jgi:hypothetical protein
MVRQKLSEDDKRHTVNFTAIGKDIKRLDKIVAKLSGKYSTTTRQTILERLLIDFLDEREKNENKRAL